MANWSPLDGSSEQRDASAQYHFHLSMSVQVIGELAECLKRSCQVGVPITDVLGPPRKCFQDAAPHRLRLSAVFAEVQCGKTGRPRVTQVIQELSRLVGAAVVDE